MSRPISTLLNPSDSSTGRQSPFMRRQNSSSPAPTVVRAPSASPSPTKSTILPSSSSSNSLSPTKASPFVRRPSQISQQPRADRAASPFARPSSVLGVPSSPSRQVSNASSRFSSYDQDPEDREAAVTTPQASPTRLREASMTPQTSPSRLVSRTTEREATPTRPVVLPSRASREDTPTLSLPELLRDLPPQLDGPASSSAAPSQANLRPTAPSTTTASTVSTIKAPIFAPSTSTSKPNFIPSQSRPPPLNHTFSPHSIPPALLSSLRESFLVLDPASTGTLTPASLTAVLEQLGLDSSPSTISTFFPSSSQPSVSLARYLDSLSAPLAQLSERGELEAAFEAWDVDDSGQIDLAELRQALMRTAEEDGLSEREIEGILGEFGGRRAFGAKGRGLEGKGRGEVFRYREFMAGVMGGSVGEGEGLAV